MLIYEDLNVRDFSKPLRQLFATPQPLLLDPLWGHDPPVGNHCSTGNCDRLYLCRFAGYHVDFRTIRKQVHRVESRMEYFWALRSKNAHNIKAL